LTSWSAVPGGFTSNVIPGACGDVSNNIHLLARRESDGAVFLNNFDQSTSTWQGWNQVSPALTTPYAPACVTHDSRVYGFVTRADGHVVFKDLFSSAAWVEVPPANGVTDAAPSATVAQGQLVLAVKGVGAGAKPYINTLSVAQLGWSGWVQVPGSVTVDSTPVVGSFQDEVYLLTRTTDGLGTIQAQVQLLNGTWTDPATIPSSNPGSDKSVAFATLGSQAYLFLKGRTDNIPREVDISRTGNWNTTATTLPNPGTVSGVATATGLHGFLFGLGVTDHQIYVRQFN
jgi:hypothetical protein